MHVRLAFAAIALMWAREFLPDRERYNTSSLFRITSGGAALPEKLRQDVERLLRQDQQAGSFLEEAAFTRTSWIGRRIRTYEFVALLGVGMGEVYRARDTKLQRDVAIIRRAYCANK